ncbi:MAG: phosphoribosylanthranilate isomerase [Gammaproteobacteria bacterium]|nr:phosphoribosylanthranilate isomerase [Gammaproteobacteria bacterium]MBT8444812.1 phosphoribosylanthranilate isomerase [Gammaproteobacteria bacterium]NND36496.1 phosphoribosylanthranilate isomerase [Gammaproteobacteria bacterium]
MALFVKICGLTTETDVAAAVEAGADALGFVFAESPRRVTVEQAATLTSEVPASIVRVAVMRHPTLAEWEEVESGFRPDWLQSDVVDFDRFDCGARVTRMPVYRDSPGLDADQIAREQRVLFEAASSGIGERADWELAARLAATTRLMLAGGLDPDNVAEAIRQVRPWGVDVSSGVEKRRGVKDPIRIAAFVSAVRELEN